MKTKIINIMLNHLTDEQKEKVADEILLIDKRGLDEILGNLKTIEIRKTTFDSLFKHILSVNFCETWNQYETDDKSPNPLVVFETSQWTELRDKLKDFIDKNRNDSYDDNTTEFDLEVGGLVGLYHRIDIRMNKNLL